MTDLTVLLARTATHNTGNATRSHKGTPSNKSTCRNVCNTSSGANHESPSSYCCEGEPRGIFVVLCSDVLGEHITVGADWGV